MLFPNEPVNKQSVNLYLTNNNVTAQYIANRMLEAAREDLQVMFDINYEGLQLEAGDIVTVTNTNYGWAAKEFRISKVVEKFSDNGQVTASLTLMEFNAQIYDDKNITYKWYKICQHCHKHSIQHHSANNSVQFRNLRNKEKRRCPKRECTCNGPMSLYICRSIKAI